MVEGTVTVTDAPASPTMDQQKQSRSTNWLHYLAFRKIGAIYILALIILIFSIWLPGTFPHWATVQQVLDSNSIVALAALALVIPLSAAVFDLSIPYTMSLSGVLVAYWVAHGASVSVALLGAMLASVAIGVVNGSVVVLAKIDSFIGTLATGSLILSLITMVSHDNNIESVRLSGAFTNIAQGKLFGFTLPVLYAVVVAGIIWHVQEKTGTGRRLYATGFNREAARLAGIRTGRLRFWSLVVSSTVAGATGIVLASQLSAGSPTAGTSYLLPAFAAAFLGATQFKEGRFNAWGTIVAVLLLGVGTTGLGLANAPSWSESFFTGIVLIAALAVTGVQRRKATKGAGTTPENEAPNNNQAVSNEVQL